jgi:general secretion pathway protein B
MSLILEALKKSEQQRQQKHAGQQPVRKRTLSIGGTGQGQRSAYWLLVGLVALLFLAAGWFFSHMKGLSQQPPPTVQAAPPSNNASPSEVPGPVSGTVGTSQPLPQAPVQDSGQGVSQPALQSPTQTPVPVPAQAISQKALSVEPAPVPREFVETPAPVRATPSFPAKTAKKNRVAAVQPTQPPAVETAADVSPQQPPASTAAPTATGPNGIPFYQDLSEELRARMPSLSMSMHFFARDPDRRLVRINGRLMRQGDWLDDNLQLVEITGDGATLDFLGKAFALSSSRR